jgi:predicted NAD/FAD-dependent oxidoreductase
MLLGAFAAAAKVELPEPLERRAHRWSLAIPETVLPARCLFDDEAGIGACGDWCAGPRVEGAFSSGAAVAGRVLTRMARRTASAQSRLF